MKVPKHQIDLATVEQLQLLPGQILLQDLPEAPVDERIKRLRESTERNIIIAGRKSPYSLYFKDLASFGEGIYDHKDAAGFINLYGLSTGVSAIVHKGISKDTGEAPTIKEIARFHEK